MKGSRGAPPRRSAKPSQQRPEIQIVKHFEPCKRKSYNLEYELPEVNYNMDERIEKTSAGSRQSHRRSIITKPLTTNKTNVIANKIVQKLEGLQSKSHVESRKSLDANSKFSFSSSTSSNLLRHNNLNNSIAEKIGLKLQRFGTESRRNASSSKFSLSSQSSSFQPKSKSRKIKHNLIADKIERKLQSFQVNDDTIKSKAIKSKIDVEKKPSTAKGYKKSVGSFSIKSRSPSKSTKESSKYSITSSENLEGVKSVHFQSRRSKSCTDGEKNFAIEGILARKYLPANQNIDESYIQSLKREIALSKYGDADNEPNGVNYDEIANHLKEEIGMFMNDNILEKQQCLTELRTEIANFRTRSNFHVYQVSGISNIYGLRENGKSTNCACKSSTNFDQIADDLSSTPNRVKEPSLPSTRGSARCQATQMERGTTELSPERSAISQEDLKKSSSTDSSEDIATKINRANILINRVKETLDEFKSKSASATPNDALLFEDTVLSTPTDSDKENLLKPKRPTSEPKRKTPTTSDRDKTFKGSSHSKKKDDTSLTKSEEKSEHVEEETLIYEETSELTSSIIQLRPTTRRGKRSEAPMEFENKFSNIPLEVGDKFRTTPIDGETPLDCDNTDMEVLHAKLDAISERTDSEDVSSVYEASVKKTVSAASSIKPTSNAQKVTTSVASNTDKLLVNVVVTTNTSCNTESVASQMKQTQTMPTMTQASATQCHCDAVETSAQTDETITLNPENTNSMHRNPRRKNKLQVQLLTPINIGHTLVSQNTLHYSIDATGRTNIFHKNVIDNAAFIEVSSPKITEKTMKVDIRITDEYRSQKQYTDESKPLDGVGVMASKDGDILEENDVKSISTDKRKKDFDECICKRGQSDHIPEKNENIWESRGQTREKSSKKTRSEPCFQPGISSKIQEKELFEDLASPQVKTSETTKQVLTQVSNKLQKIKYLDQKEKDHIALEEGKLSFIQKEETDQVSIALLSEEKSDIISIQTSITESDHSKNLKPSSPNREKNHSYTVPLSTVESKASDVAPDKISILSKPRVSDAAPTLSESSAEKTTSPIYYLYKVSDSSKLNATTEDSRIPMRNEDEVGHNITKEVAKKSQIIVREKDSSIPKNTTTKFGTGASSTKDPTESNSAEPGCSTNAVQSLGKINDLMTFSSDAMDLPIGEIYYRDIAKCSVSPVSSYTSKGLGKSASKKFKNSTTGSQSSDKEKILKSYHIYDNVNEHDPGVLTTSSFDLIGIIDEDVYKTYINPRGYRPPPKYDLNVVSSNILEPTKKIITLEKIASSKFLPSLRSSCERETFRPATPTVKDDIQDEKAQKKLWDLGLYASKATQYSIQEEASLEKMKALDPNQSYETLSFTLSYSTDESISPDNSLKAIRHKSSGEYKSEIFKTNHSSRSTNYRKSLPHLADEQHTVLKTLKEKLSKNLPTNDDLDDAMEDVGSLVREDQSLSKFIVGLTGSEKIKRVSKQVRKSFQKSESKFRRRDDYDVLPVHVHGDCIPDNFHNIYTPLDQAGNGRYKDEEDLFHETQHVKEKRRNLEYFMKPRHKNIYDKCSNSDSVTTEHSFSEGEIKCQCSVSLGEVHRCRYKDKLNRKIPNIPFQMNGFKTIRRRRTYFNNWVTYYGYNNQGSLNDTSISTSSS